MNENIKKLFEEIAKDKALATKFEGCKSVEDAYALATSVVDGYTIEEFKNVLAAAKVENGELSDSELEGVAGGFGIAVPTLRLDQWRPSETSNTTAADKPRLFNRHQTQLH